ncbi:unnamed protein product [Spirodela intermedia]|uniref:ZF-HD dimerization-type domain-containing protein n=1 Tax=Spirodela intermedia TaxID=51605 RepID=A0A7I8KSF0_SPIIN|nr:unnamed protein product [Spirodela intermedia]
MDLPGLEGEILIPIASAYADDHAHVRASSDESPFHHSNGPLALPAPVEKKAPAAAVGMGITYRECLRNHAAAMGGTVLDGCGEFMPSGEEGTPEAFRCSACNCHRNFHRKEVEGEASYSCYSHFKGMKLLGQNGVLISGTSEPYFLARGSHPMIMPLGAAPPQSSESEEMEGGAPAAVPAMKKRFRTKFTPEQKEKMQSFAEKVGWRLQKEEEGAVQQFCQEIGVKRRVLKVWMHNNKNNLAKKSPLPLE